MNQIERTRITYRYELWRAVPAGVLEAAASVFLLLLAVRWFHASSLSKGLIAGGASLGFLLAPSIVLLVERLKWPVARALTWLAAIGAAGFIFMALVPTLAVYVAGSVLALTTASASIPL